uniref:ELYS-like domain-containing protein n=1 Tax=Peronospora matthiolae TaxID=2874970 RepID=A0AAV1V605_9STRA
MLLPVLERFAEFGWQLFVEPAETFEFFSVSGIFQRENVDVSLQAEHAGAQLLVQRSALFDVCLQSGLAHLIVAYIRAHEAPADPQSVFVDAKTYVLKEPIAVQQWVRRRLEAVEHDVTLLIAHEQEDRVHEAPDTVVIEAMDGALRKLHGLRTVLIALLKRLKEGSHQAACYTTGVDAEGNVRKETELARLTTQGIQSMLHLLCRTHSMACACDCILWLHENNVAGECDMYNEFYSEARSLRVTYGEQFEEIYGNKLSCSSTLKEPVLLIEHVMKSAGIPLDELGGSCPPTRLRQLLEVLQASTVQEDVVQYYGDEVDSEPIEEYFRVRVALLLYFCLDRAYLSVWKHRIECGAQIAKKMRAFADSFAAQLSVRDDIKLTLLALWLVENAVVVKTSSDDEVAAIYENAVGLLQLSSATHLRQTYDQDIDLILYLLETLVHRGERLVAWKVWNTFNFDLTQSPPAATDLMVVISLELDSWERALSLIRSQKRPDLLDVLFNWLMKSHRLKEIVQCVTFLPAEEELFHTYMMESNVTKDEDILRDENIKRVDFLVMYYVLRNRHQQAWKVHHTHLAIIRAMSRGDTEIAMATLNQPSLRVRAALLSNMCAEPPSESSLHQNIDLSAQMEGRQHFTNSALFESDAMEDVSDPDTPALATSASVDSCSTEVRYDEKRVASAGAFVSAPTDHSTHSKEMAEAGEVDYFPGMFSSRQPTGTPTRCVKASSPLVTDEKTSTRSKDKGREKTTFGDISVESIDSSTDVSLNLLTTPNPRATDPTGSQDVGDQATKFGSSLAKASSASSTPLQSFMSPFGDRRPLGTPPVRSKIHPTFAFTSLTPPAPNVAGSTDDFSLKPHYIDGTNSNSFPGETQDHTMVTADARGNRTAQQTSTAAPSTPDSDAIMETPERYQFVRELSTSLRGESEYMTSRATKEQVEGMLELERVDDEFSTPVSRPKGQRKQPASVPVRRNPRRSTRQKY